MNYLVMNSAVAFDIELIVIHFGRPLRRTLRSRSRKSRLPPYLKDNSKATMDRGRALDVIGQIGDEKNLFVRSYRVFSGHIDGLTMERSGRDC